MICLGSLLSITNSLAGYLRMILTSCITIIIISLILFSSFKVSYISVVSVPGSQVFQKVNKKSNQGKEN